MIITVKILNGKECSIEVATGALISVVKQKVATELDIPVDKQRLVFKGKTLVDSQTLCDYNIVDGNKLHLFIRKNEEPQPGPSVTTVLWDQMQRLLEKYYSPENANKILQEYKKSFETTYQSLSLDDLERLAIYNLDGNAFCSANESHSKENC